MGLTFASRMGTMVGERWSMLSKGGFIEIGQALKAGIYLLTYKGEVVYVGQSRDLLRRLYEHRLNYLRFKSGKKGHPYSQAKAVLFDGIQILPCNPFELDRLERQYIALHQPKHNKKLKGKVANGPFEISVNGQKIVVGAPEEPPPPGPQIRRRV